MRLKGQEMYNLLALPVWSQYVYLKKRHHNIISSLMLNFNVSKMYPIRANVFGHNLNAGLISENLYIYRFLVGS
jgi:hypothetical protein